MRSSLKGKGRIVKNSSKIQIASELWVMLLPGLDTACASRNNSCFTAACVGWLSGWPRRSYRQQKSGSSRDRDLADLVFVTPVLSSGLNVAGAGLQIKRPPP